MTPLQPIPAWQTALRFTTTGVLVAALFLSMWWIGRLADHVENYRQLLVDIQRDVLVIVAKVETFSAVANENARRLTTVEDRATRGAEDRQALQSTDQELIEALRDLRGTVDDIREGIGVPPGSPGMGGPGMTSRRK